MRPASLLAVADLRVAFAGDRGDELQAVAGISFSIAPGRTLGEGMRTRSSMAIAASRAALADRPRCRISTSPIWSPMVKLGLSDVIGS